MYENLSYTEMSARLHYSEKHIKYLSVELTNAEAEIDELKNELNRVNELLRLAVKKTYASSSEKIENCGQLTFLEENEENPATIKREVKSYLRAPKRSYEEIYKNLPVEIKEYDISDAEKICDRCQSEMVCIGYDSYREIEYTPAVIKVIEHRRKKYACKKCDLNGISGNIKTALSPLPLFEHSLVSLSFLAYITAADVPRLLGGGFHLSVQRGIKIPR